MIRHKFRFSKGERKIFERRRPIPVSEWAEKYRVLEMSAIPGRWRNLFTPYLVGIMDAAGKSGVETVIICKSPQTGGSEAGHNLVGWCIDRCPGPVMYVFPDELTARENARDRIIPMLESSPRLRGYMTSLADDAPSLRINLAHMPIYMSWSGSVARLGNKPVRTLILDELDKYKNPKNEATSEVLAEKRTTTWRDKRHIFKISTPTTESGPIWRAFTEEAQARFDYFVRCQMCGKMQLMNLERIGWPGKDSEKLANPEEIMGRRLAWYACEHCGAIWTDADRDLAVRKGQWRERASGLELFSHLELHKPAKIGFHIPAWLSYFVSLSEVAAAILRYQKSGRIEDQKNLQNQYKAEPWQPETIKRSDASILTLCDDRPAGTVPPAIDNEPRIACLLAGVDTQGINDVQGYFPFVIRAFGYGESEESWLVKAGIAANLAELDKILWQTAYKAPDGAEFPVRACMIDAMGNRTREIYAYALAHRGRVFAWQGKRSMSQPYTTAMQEFFPDAHGRKIRIPGGLNLWKCDTTFFKSDLARRLSLDPAAKGAFHLHSNADGGLNEYARQMTAEYWDDEQMAWVNPKHKANHLWDCEVMCLALAWILNVRLAKVSEPPAPKPQTTLKRAPASISDRLSKWRR